MSHIARTGVISRTIWRSMAKEKIVEGVFAINKPTGISSAQVLRDCQDVFHTSKLFAPYLQHLRSNLQKDNPNQRKRRKVKDPKVKIGHGGTLDPLATGVLIAGVGVGTKSLGDFLKCTKTYECILLFGASTDTYDRVGKVLRRAPYEHITRELVEEKMQAFKGTFLQLPPIFSALKMNGKPLYEYAREGKPIPREIERRPVEVSELEILEWMEGGTHDHKAPTEEGSEAEKKVAQEVWAQSGFQNGAPTAESDTKEAAAQKEFEGRKRKMSEDQDELVKEKPSKQLKASNEDAVMSGGLSDTTEEPAPSASQSNTIVAPTTSAPSSPVSKGPPAARIRMTVTSGFYVRSFCQDLGTAVGSAGLMAELVRSRQGDFSFESGNVIEYSDLKEGGEQVWGPLIDRMTTDWWAKKAKEVETPVEYAFNSVRQNGEGGSAENAEVSNSAAKDDAKDSKAAEPQNLESVTEPAKVEEPAEIEGPAKVEEPAAKVEKPAEIEGPAKVEEPVKVEAPENSAKDAPEPNPESMASKST
ncbi:hypothetical protein HYFRA_00008972 [Hymenoscyphus fraxineus]|uniref:tRNA pseudouridine(55) synthase n=1 Tax=Hymenoscyphus fraxineus TaxID=746836 RepID=A0A9N9KTN6_9HELO|nr:hypothetical protein HYFRA_00008972 [Hymenoscyphus fraxineus]